MKITIENARSGMKLAGDVFLKTGSLLAAEGAILDDKLVETLKSNGIAEISIEKPPENQGLAAEDSAGASPQPGHGISVSVSENSMAASLTIDPQTMGDTPLTAELLIDALNSNGVVFGIQQKTIDEILKKWNAEKRYYEFEKVATGSLPAASASAKLEMQVPCITDAGKLELAKKATYCWELKSSGMKFHRVKPGDLIAKKGATQPGAPGRNVFGAEIKGEEIKPLNIVFDESVEMAAEGAHVVARAEGLAYLVGEKIGVVGIKFDGSAEVTVSSDKMKADLVAHPAMDGGAAPAEAAIRALLAEKKITYGIDEGRIKELADKMSKGQYPSEPVTIAQGVPPSNGEDGSIEFLFNAKTSLAPKQNDDGSVDFKNINLVCPVVAGTELARRIAPKKGSAGSDVFGNKIQGKDGADEKLPAGNGTKISPSNPDTLVAEFDGNVKFDGKTVSVQEGYAIDGDVDYSTGNVKYNKAVSIGGDVKSGFEVDCGGDLQIGGVVEDAKIKAAGSVLVKAGFVGHGNGLIESTGDVNLGFIHNQAVHCEGSVSIAKEALDCTIMARKSVVILGEPISTVGSRITAGESITVRGAGNKTGTKTELIAGVDYVLLKQAEETDHQLDQIAKNEKKLQQIEQRYTAIIKSGRKLPKKDETLHEKVKETMHKYIEEAKTLEVQKKELAQKTQDLEKSYIKIERSAMPGTVLKIGNCQYHVQDEIIGPKTARVAKGTIELI